jgi:hypothetical protein
MISLSAVDRIVYRPSPREEIEEATASSGYKRFPSEKNIYVAEGLALPVRLLLHSTHSSAQPLILMQSTGHSKNPLFFLLK